MKKINIFLIIFICLGCYNIYGVALNEEKSNTIPTIDHVDYKMHNQDVKIPKSIILFATIVQM